MAVSRAAQQGSEFSEAKEETSMSGPFIFIGTYKIKSDKRAEFKKGVQELVEFVETNEPRLIAFNIYLDEQGSKVSVVQVHPDAASMEFHMKVVSEHIRNAFEYLETTESAQVYGTPSAALAEMLRKFADPRASETFMLVHEVGFTRTSAR
jgi:quinol monooxygenase YgiN